jgi:hypothetical protein
MGALNYKNIEFVNDNIGRDILLKVFIGDEWVKSRG